jgi:hypothetical protein
MKMAQLKWTKKRDPWDPFFLYADWRSIEPIKLDWLLSRGKMPISIALAVQSIHNRLYANQYIMLFYTASWDEFSLR